MSTSSLESSEDLDHVTLVRMEDVQPDKSADYLDDAMIENLEYDNECIIDGDDEEYTSEYAIGSMVPIKWGEVEDIDGDSQEIESLSSDCASDTQEKLANEDSNDTSEYIIPDVMKTEIIVQESTQEAPNKSPSSWPTLEILPGGVIKDAEKYESLHSKNKAKTAEMVYACAKCPEKYKLLYCLVRHVKWHTDQEKLLKSENGIVPLPVTAAPKVVTPSRSLLKPLKKEVVQPILTNDRKEQATVQKILKLKKEKKRNKKHRNRTKLKSKSLS